MLKTSVEQLADTIRGEIEKGRWGGAGGDMPGHKNLASELGANSRTVARALEQLEKEGLLQSQGPGRRRKIVPTKVRIAAREVKVILYERGDASDSAIRELRRCLENAGYAFSFAPKSLNELKQHPARVAKSSVRDEDGASRPLCGLPGQGDMHRAALQDSWFRPAGEVRNYGADQPAATAIKVFPPG